MAEKYRWDRGKTDSDGDGLSDDFERDVLGTKVNEKDSDGDGLNDYRELAFATNPMEDDTDGDGLEDGREVTIGTNPHSDDSDGDKLSDGEEKWLRTSPNNIHSDADRLPDDVEVYLGKDPRTPVPPPTGPRGQPIPGATDPGPDGTQAVMQLDLDDVQVAGYAVDDIDGPIPQTNWNDPSATENLDPVE